jgi:hypothetical protein
VVVSILLVMMVVLVVSGVGGGVHSDVVGSCVSWMRLCIWCVYWWWK